jgi:hypothetical protein
MKSSPFSSSFGRSSSFAALAEMYCSSPSRVRVSGNRCRARRTGNGCDALSCWRADATSVTMKWAACPIINKAEANGRRPAFRTADGRASIRMT